MSTGRACVNLMLFQHLPWDKFLAVRVVLQIALRRILIMKAAYRFNFFLKKLNCCQIIVLPRRVYDLSLGKLPSTSGPG